MAATWRRRFVAVLVLAAFLPAGCNMLAVPFFLFGPEPKIEPSLRSIAPKDKEKDRKVVVLTYSNNIEMRPELLRADRDITNHIDRLTILSVDFIGDLAQRLLIPRVQHEPSPTFRRETRGDEPNTRRCTSDNDHLV